MKEKQKIEEILSHLNHSEKIIVLEILKIFLTRLGINIKIRRLL
jgi:hypothetical protein